MTSMIISMLPSIHMTFFADEMSRLASEVRDGKVNPFVYILVTTVVQLPVVVATSLVSMLIFHGVQGDGASWSTFGQSVGSLAAFICVYESLAQAFSSFGVATGMVMYMFL